MDANFVNELIAEAMADVNISVVVLLLAVGFIIKHVKKLEKISNDLIPPILLVISLVYEVIMGGFSFEIVVTAVVTAAVAIGLHQEGKNIFTVSIGPKVYGILEGMSDSTIISKLLELFKGKDKTE